MLYEAVTLEYSLLEELKKEYILILKKLEKAAMDGEISYYYMRSIIEMTQLVLENLAKKYENVRKGVGSVMGGNILEHESKTIHNEGIKEGCEVGLEEGRKEGPRKAARRSVQIQNVREIEQMQLRLNS